MRIRPHIPAIIAYTRVPFDKVSQGDFLIANNLTARHALGCKMEFLAICYHARLGWSWGLDAVACRRSRGWGCSSRRTDDAHAYVDVGLHAGTIAVHGGVPFDEIGQADLLVADDLVAGDATRDPVELVAIGYHA